MRSSFVVPREIPIPNPKNRIGFEHFQTVVPRHQSLVCRRFFCGESAPTNLRCGQRQEAPHADGDAAFAKATGLTLDLHGKGMGLRSNRYSMLVRDGKVVTLNVEAPGQFAVSDADTLLAQAKA